MCRRGQGHGSTCPRRQKRRSVRRQAVLSERIFFSVSERARPGSIGARPARVRLFCVRFVVGHAVCGVSPTTRLRYRTRCIIYVFMCNVLKTRRVRRNGYRAQHCGSMFLFRGEGGNDLITWFENQNRKVTGYPVGAVSAVRMPRAKYHATRGPVYVPAVRFGFID